MMTGVVNQAPAFTRNDAERLAFELFGQRGEAKSLPSDRDQNFRIECGTARVFVLKVSNANESFDFLDLQAAILKRLATAKLDLRFPRVIQSKTDESVVSVLGPAGDTHFVRLLAYVPGRRLATVKPHDVGLLGGLGASIAAMRCALIEFDHAAAHRVLDWDVKRVLSMRAHLRAIENPARRKQLAVLFDLLETTTLPQLDALPHSVIHNDWNDHNVLVSEVGELPRRVTGLIDFGDAVYSVTLAELAIAIAYAMLDKRDPIATACHIVAGYNRVHPLTDAELRVLFPLVQARLAQSVCMSAIQKRAAPDNAYLTVTEQPAWALLERLRASPQTLPYYRFRTACGLEPCPLAQRIAGWLKDTRPFPVMGRPLNDDRVHVYDLSVGRGPLDDELLHDERIGIGRYNEARAIYNAAAFTTTGFERPLQRSVHLGIDLFGPAGTEFYVPLDGVVHSFRDNDTRHDYGPTILLAHDCPEGRFYTLYGHLSRDSIKSLHAGQQLRSGDKLGCLGTIGENGGWLPHLHFQIITDLLDFEGTFPGTASPDEVATWTSLCPDPNLILGIPQPWLAPDDTKPSAQALERRRTRHLGSTLSLSYRTHLHIVRGYMQHLYDATGQRYLDAVNNVPHVGHCHPRVVEAAYRQLKTLNSNTRYLHRHVVELAERLAATLPDPLSVCYFVCSGSEANELALRLAQAHTKSHRLLVLDHAYHGNTGNLVAMSPYKFQGKGGFRPPDHVHVLPVPDAYGGKFRGQGPDVKDRYIESVEEAASAIARTGEGPATFFCESLPGCAGQIELVPGYLPSAYAAVRAAGGICVADEVQVGFGRVGSHFWGFETHGVVPDIVTMGKPMGNGHPVAAVVTTPEIARSFDTGMEYFNTFGGNPVSCATALAVLDVLAEEGLQARAGATGTAMLANVRKLATEHPVIGDVRGRGLFLGIELVCDREQRTPATEVARYVAERMKDRGILISTDGPNANVLKIKPPLAFTAADGEHLVATLASILDEDIPRARCR